MMSRHLFFTCTLLALLLTPPGETRGFELIDSDNIVHRRQSACSSIISLYPAHSENLAEMGATDVLIGISTSDTYPESILALPRFSLHDTAERFIAAQPDCLLVRPMISHRAPDLLKKLRTFGITVISLQPNTAQEMIQYWRDLGQLSGSSEGAERMIGRFDSKLSPFRDKTAATAPDAMPRVYFEAIHARMRTFSPASIAIFCLQTAGGVNVAADAVPRRGTNIADYGKERILSRAGIIDFFLAQTGRMNPITIPEIMNEPGFGAIKAIREGRVHLLPEELVSRPTSRLIEGITMIHDILYQ